MPKKLLIENTFKDAVERKLKGRSLFFTFFFVLELAGERNEDNKKTRVVPRRILIGGEERRGAQEVALRVTIASGGVMPNIHNLSSPKKTGGGASNRYPCFPMA
ncbi:hypothetical protein Syun_007964 [Stephania yunnanensis]|uniref:Histone H2A C-terminal domain-containing protein n=1 Tax=Stephania yunnanensis TaxID=152371 RepID=A0AAP0KZG7_9MAGN